MTQNQAYHSKKYTKENDINEFLSFLGMYGLLEAGVHSILKEFLINPRLKSVQFNTWTKK